MAFIDFDSVDKLVCVPTVIDAGSLLTANMLFEKDFDTGFVTFTPCVIEVFSCLPDPFFFITVPTGFKIPGVDGLNTTFCAVENGFLGFIIDARACRLFF